MSTQSKVEEHNTDDEIRKLVEIGGDKPWVQAFAISNRGKVRNENQDRFALESVADQALVAVVADGMGGHLGGSHAAEIASRTIMGVLRQAVGRDDQIAYGLLSQSFSEADEAIRQQASKDTQLGGMGTTGVAVVVLPDRCIHLYTGDSRLYHYRQGTEIYRTKDHSVVRYLEEEGLLTAEEARSHPMRSRLTSSLGGGPAERKLVLEPRWLDDGTKQPSIMDLLAGDLLLLCSDGLCGEVEPARLAELVHKHHESPQELGRQCVDAALAAGGRDNITTILVRVL